MWLFLVEVGVAIVTVAGWVTQILLPLQRGEPLYPLFWSKQERLETEEKRLRQRIHEHVLEDSEG